jgi:hypothetical protein
MGNPNLQLLTDAAKLLKPVVGELVFVGGCVTPLLIRQLPGPEELGDGGRIQWV